MVQSIVTGPALWRPKISNSAPLTRFCNAQHSFVDFARYVLFNLLLVAKDVRVSYDELVNPVNDPLLLLVPELRIHE